MSIVHVPATPGNHVPDHDTFAALSTMLALCLRIRREAIEPDWTGLGREVATWTLPDGHEIVRVRHRDRTTYRQTITASHPQEPMIARLIVDGCALVETRDPHIDQCIADVVVARSALEGVPGEPCDALVDRIDAASIELMRSIADADGLATDRPLSADHWPATPWREGRILMSGADRSGSIGNGASDFPMVVVVAVDEPYGVATRISVRLFPYHMDHTVPTTVDPMARLRGAEALDALKRGRTS